EIGVIGGADETTLAAAVAEAAPQKGVEVATATECADDQVAALTGGTDMIGALMLAFAVIALFVSTIVIANTFSILLARRARDTALMRAIGSTRGQVVGSALLEAVVIGLVFSGLGVLVGIGMAKGLALAGETLGGDAVPEIVFTVPARAVVVPLVVGLLVVLVAAVRPVLRSSRVAPLEALRPDAAVTARSRRGVLRNAAGIVLLGLGGAARAAGAARPSAASGRRRGRVSVPRAALASGASAPLVGVTLVTMPAVGTATTKTVVNDIVDEQYPVDVMVQGADISGTSARSLERVDGVDTTALLSGSTVDAPGIDVTNQPVSALP